MKPGVKSTEFYTTAVTAAGLAGKLLTSSGVEIEAGHVQPLANVGLEAEEIAELVRVVSGSGGDAVTVLAIAAVVVAYIGARAWVKVNGGG